MKEFIDSSVFLGMHSTDEGIRITCKNFFVKRINSQIFMSFETIGECDDIIWSFSRIYQDSYYPFMDRLHTIMKIKRIPFSLSEVRLLIKDETLKSKKEGLNLAQSIVNKGFYYTFDTKLLSSSIKNIKKLPFENRELPFTKDLENFYQSSLLLRINLESVNLI